MKVLLACLLFFLTNFIHSQSCDTTKITTLIKSGYKLFDDGNMQETFKLFTEARSLLNAKDCEIKAAMVYLAMGRYYIANGENQKADPIVDSCILFAKKFNQLNFLNDAYIRKGNILLDNGKYDNALELFYRAQKYFESVKNRKRTGDCYQRIGLVFKRQSRWEDALVNYRKAKVIAEELKDYSQMTSLMNNFAGLKYNQGQIDSALHYFKLAEDVCKKASEKKLFLKIKSNIAIIYVEQKKYDEGKKILLECLEIARKDGNMEMQTTILMNMGDLNMRLKNFPEAISFYNQAYERVTKIKNLNMESYVVESLVTCYDTLRKYPEAYKLLKRLHSIKDSLEVKKNSKRMVELKLQNEYERKSLSDSLKTVEDKKLSEVKLKEEKTKRNYLYGGIFLLVIVLGIIVNRFRITQRQKLIIEKQKKEVETQKQMVDEKQKEILDSINYAKRIQNAIIPSKQTLTKNLENYFLFYKPKDIVAGDFYWFQKVGDRKLIAVADCTGHGVPGALVSVVCSNALNTAVKEFGLTSPADILNKTREIVLEAFAMSEETINDGMDISLISIQSTFNSELSTVEWSGANNSLWYVKQNEFHEIKANKFPIGRAYISGNFTNHTIELSKGDYFILYSDGFADQFGGNKGKKYKYKNLISFIREKEASGNSFTEMSEILEQEFEKWKGENEQIDDVCVLGIKL